MEVAWHHGYSRRDGCRTCGARTDLLTIHLVVPWRGWHNPRGATHIVSAYGRCANRAACRARVSKRRDRAQTRASRLVLREPAAPASPRGTCRWCGDPIRRPDGRPDRRRNYHDEYVRPCKGNGWATVLREPPEPPCADEWRRSYVYDGRDAIRLTTDGPIACADCGAECAGAAREVEQDGYRHHPRAELLAWEADHEVPLEDGGEHALENLRPRCVPCHKAKTGRENAERARRRREGATGQGALEVA